MSLPKSDAAGWSKGRFDSTLPQDRCYLMEIPAWDELGCFIGL